MAVNMSTYNSLYFPGGMLVCAGETVIDLLFGTPVAKLTQLKVYVFEAKVTESVALPLVPMPLVTLAKSP